MGAGEAIFGREAVVDGEHAATRAFGEAAAQHVMAVEIAEHEAAAMEEQDARAGRHAGAEGHVKARLDIAGGARNDQRTDFRQLRRIRLGAVVHAQKLAAQAVDGEFQVKRLQFRKTEPAPKIAKGVIERHVRATACQFRRCEGRVAALQAPGQSRPGESGVRAR